MVDANSETDLRWRAERRVTAKIGFRNHLVIYLFVNSCLAVLNLMTTPRALWFLWPVFGWGIGLVVHGLTVYGTGEVNRERAVQAEMERIRRR
jgi:two-component system, LytTR family, sensor kinase